MSVHHPSTLSPSAQTVRQPTAQRVPARTTPVARQHVSAPPPAPCTDVDSGPIAPLDTAVAVELQAIAQLLEADRACGKASGYVKEARTRLKRLLAARPT